MVANATNGGYMKRIAKWIGLTERCALLYRMKAFEDLGISASGHMYIFCLCNNNGISQEELVKRIYVNKSNVARNIKTLEESGFVTRKVDDSDKRVYKIYPTAKAYEVYPIIKDRLTILNEALIKGFSDSEVDTLFDMLKRVALNACDFINKEITEENE